jgi:NAD(P)-dependent dehydrogenase (short-subunit alcohol dehydrogenase family)
VVVVITGGAGGMGLATARIVGRDHPLVITDVGEERLDVAVLELHGAGIDVQAFAADVTDRASVDAVFDAARARGPISAVINTAGLSPLMGSGELILGVNALGTIHVNEAAYAAAGEGLAVVNVASMAGHLLPRLASPTRAYRLALTDPSACLAGLERAVARVPAKSRSGLAYSISKNFVIWYSAAQAARFGAKGARVLSVSPGSFDTEMGRLEIRSGSEKMLRYAALKRFGTPDEIAEVLAFCASEKAGYLTGTDVLVDGGNVAGFGLKAMIAIARGS